MRSYFGSEKILQEIICNCCGKRLSVKNGAAEEGHIEIEVPFGYFSQKDGQRHSFDLCEECYDRIIAKFKYPVEITERTEFL